MFRKTLGAVNPTPNELDALMAMAPKEDEEIQNHAEVALPTNFDARTKWPNCPSIREIQSQSQCKLVINLILLDFRRIMLGCLICRCFLGPSLYRFKLDSQS
jgi:hypothetical protein